MKKIICEIFAVILTLVILLTTSLYLGYLFMPIRENYGATWNMYLEEEEESIDIMFIGSSLAYCDIIPARIYEETGLTSYIMGAPNMNPGIAYYYLKESIKTQSPKLVMLEATSFCFSGITKEDSKVNIGYMPYSLNRLQATFEVADPSERLGLLFPLYNYHSSWEDFSFGDLFKPRPDCITDIWAGYTFLDSAKPQTEIVERVYSIEDDTFKENMDYLHKIADFCLNEGIKLELFMVPSCKYVSKELTEKIQNEAGDIPLTRFNDKFDSLGLDIEKDFYDSLHLNFSGAVKFSDIMAKYISDNYSLPNYSHDKNLWQERVRYLNDKKEKTVIKVK